MEPSFRPWLDRVAQAHEMGADGVAVAEFRLGGAFAHTVEYRRLAAHLAARRGARDEAIRLACSAATDDNASTETLIDVALLLRELGRPVAALDALARVPWWLAPDWFWRVHFVQGDVLDDLASHVAALAHLQNAVALCERSWIEGKPTTTDVAHLRGTIGYVLLFRFADPAQAHSHLTAAWQDDPTAGNAVNLIVCHAALGDWASAERVWTAAVDTIADSTDERFVELRAALTARTIGSPQPTARRPPGAHSWSCPACSACLLVADTDLLCAGCGTALARATSCPCCAGNQLAGAGAGTASGLVPPKGTAVAGRSAVKTVLTFVPVAGWAINGAIAGGLTLALGEWYIQACARALRRVDAPGREVTASDVQVMIIEEVRLAANSWKATASRVRERNRLLKRSG